MLATTLEQRAMAAPPWPHSSALLPSPSGRPLRREVLLVEDNEFNQLVASELLRDVAA